MIWIFKTYGPRPVIKKLMGYKVYHGPALLKLLASDIIEADLKFEELTRIDPCKPPKGYTVLRYCPELPCNKSLF